MELKLTKEMLRFETMLGRGEEQVTIEGEATLPGSMRDAVTVLSVQAQAHATGAQAGNGEAAVRGRVRFQVLYTQGDLTRVRSLETSCSFTHSQTLADVTPSARIMPIVSVQETEGLAGSGRITLRALLSIAVEAFDTAEHEVIIGAQQEQTADKQNLQTLTQTAAYCCSELLGENKTLVREEKNLPAKLGAGDALCATAEATASEISGGSGRVSVSGRIEVRVLHRPLAQGQPLVTTVHELPYEVRIDAQLEEGVETATDVEVLDVMADCVESDKGRILRLEAEVQVRLKGTKKSRIQLLTDMYSISGALLEPVTQTLHLHTGEAHAHARESTRLQVTLPENAPPIGTMLAAFASPTITAVSPAGKRLDTEGIMQVTLIYLPVDSDIPYAVHTREPFAMTFPIEADTDVHVYARVMETAPGATTSDRAELRCVLGLHAVQHGVQHMQAATDVRELPVEKQERGFVLVWPPEGESRWETARRLRVAQESLRPAGKGALLAFRK
ncbi:MAG: DUF3794 domain-containing protein [Clostridia bacterium]|nr:DUF3794 domain-containing protein [Clostridia bacterium]